MLCNYFDLLFESVYGSFGNLKCALLKTWPLADRWPGPIPRGSSKRRYEALYVSKHIVFGCDGEVDEIMGHTYLFLKEELELSVMPPASGILHETIIDQFIACGKSRDKAYEHASQIWLAVIDNLDESEQMFLLLRGLAQEGDKLFTDFRDCFDGMDYYDILACAKLRFQPIPSAWLGY
ncbi:hypothetical protein MKX03_022295 [Papaver bracteatum]|nr:hypothetical protein MKX03_022295 [Papaver bracteatum]